MEYRKKLPTTAVTPNRWFCVNRTFYFLTSLSPSGENSVPKPRLGVAAKRYVIVFNSTLHTTFEIKMYF
jgi:hypothetical protein